MVGHQVNPRVKPLLSPDKSIIYIRAHISGLLSPEMVEPLMSERIHDLVRLVGLLDNTVDEAIYAEVAGHR